MRVPPTRSSKLTVSNSARRPAADALLAIVAREWREMNTVNVATAWHRLAKLSKQKQKRGASRFDARSDARTQILERLARENVDAFDAMNLANVVWSLAKLEIRDEELMKAVSSRASKMLVTLGHLNVQEGLTQVILGFAKCSLCDLAFRILESLCEHGRQLGWKTCSAPIAECDRLQLLPHGSLWLVTCCRAVI